MASWKCFEDYIDKIPSRLCLGRDVRSSPSPFPGLSFRKSILQRATPKVEVVLAQISGTSFHKSLVMAGELVYLPAPSKGCQ